MKIDGNTVVITGGGSGIGLALAKALNDAGNRVLICGRNADTLQAAREICPGLRTFVCDISDPAGIDALVSHVDTEFPTLNVLINNAGVQFQPDFRDPIDHGAEIQLELQTNLASPILLTDRLLPRLLDQPAAAIINVTSGLAVVPKRSAPVYCASKAGLHIFSRALRYQLEGTPVQVFEVLPALVDTAMTRDRPPKGKISPERLARDVLAGLRRDRHSIPIAHTRLLLMIHRWWPALAYRILRHQ